METLNEESKLTTNQISGKHLVPVSFKPIDFLQALKSWYVIIELAEIVCHSFVLGDSHDIH